MGNAAALAFILPPMLASYIAKTTPKRDAEEKPNNWHNPPMDPVTTALLSGLTFCLGLLIGNWLAIGRDKRREKNDAIAPVREMLLKEWERPTPMHSAPNLVQCDRILNHFIWIKRKRFVSQLKRYKDEREKAQIRTASGGVEYSSTEGIRREIDILLRKYLRPA